MFPLLLAIVLWNMTERMNETVSPLTGGVAKKIRELPSRLLAEALWSYYGEPPPSGACEYDYSLWECAETGLQFSRPARQGNDIFYRWVSRFPSYYPGLRWEYKKVIELARQQQLVSGPDSFILDVGSGKGDFLSLFGLVSPSRRLAVDVNEPAVKKCRELGFGAFCGSIEDAIGSGFVEKNQCAVVCAFHCLEHVEQPLQFVENLLQLVAPQGRLFLSTPNSPMSFEIRWFDVLNHPPHHLTRWNRRAYEKLAELTGCSVRFFAPPASLLRDSLKLFQLLKHGTKSVPRAQLAKESILNPWLALRCLGDQLRHRWRHGQPYADVILAELRKLNPE